jgi:hypothetical protein
MMNARPTPLQRAIRLAAGAPTLLYFRCWSEWLSKTARLTMSGETFSEDGEIDTFTVLHSGTYVITAIGATGGGLGVANYEGGAGAEVVGTFSLNAGDVLEILVGGAGATNAGNPNGGPDGAGSGGGGSFVYDVTTGMLLEAAGGGGGASAGSGGSGSPGGAGKPGQATTSGSAGNAYGNGLGIGPGGAGGTNGSGGGSGHLPGNPNAGSGSGGGGGGFSGSGASGDFGQGGISFLLGGAGGNGANLNNALNGGFGGGGGAASGGIGGGGGGGYSGGGGGEEDIGGGGGSFVASFATDVTETAGVNAGGNGSVMIMPCFLAGSRIATARGDVAVEDVRVGDRAVLAGGGTRPVRWIGSRRFDPARHSQPERVLPVCVRRDAFGPGLPHRDLFLSPDHAVFVEDVLIPVQYLVNGATVRQMPSFGVITYFHIELDLHDVLLAEGLPVESYLDTGNRSAFADGGASLRLHPDFAALTWDAAGCAPLVVTGPQLEAARRRCATAEAAIENRMAS